MKAERYSNQVWYSDHGLQLAFQWKRSNDGGLDLKIPNINLVLFKGKDFSGRTPDNLQLVVIFVLLMSFWTSILKLIVVNGPFRRVPLPSPHIHGTVKTTWSLCQSTTGPGVSSSKSALQTSLAIIPPSILVTPTSGPTGETSNVGRLTFFVGDQIGPSRGFPVEAALHRRQLRRWDILDRPSVAIQPCIMMYIWKLKGCGYEFGFCFVEHQKPGYQQGGWEAKLGRGFLCNHILYRLLWSFQLLPNWSIGFYIASARAVKSNQNWIVYFVTKLIFLLKSNQIKWKSNWMKFMILNTI